MFSYREAILQKKRLSRSFHLYILIVIDTEILKDFSWQVAPGTWATSARTTSQKSNIDNKVGPICHYLVVPQQTMMQNVFLQWSCFAEEKTVSGFYFLHFFLTKTESSPPRFLLHVYSVVESEATVHVPHQTLMQNVFLHSSYFIYSSKKTGSGFSNFIIISRRPRGNWIDRSLPPAQIWI